MKKKRSFKKIVNKIVIYVLLILLAIFMMGPFLWLLSVSLMPGKNVFSFPPAILPTFIDFKNYIEVWQYMDFLKYIWNTVIITFFGVTLSILLCALTAYPLGVFNFKGRNFIFLLLVSTMIIPAAAGLVVNYLTINALGLVNTFTGVILPSLVSVFNVFLFRQAFMGIPLDIRDSGKMDGASEFRIWGQLMMPMIKPSVAVVGLFEFMANWNIFLWPLIVLETDKYPLAAALSFLKGQFSYNFGWIAAGTIISVLPIILVFIFTQKYYMEGISGAVKG